MAISDEARFPVYFRERHLAQAYAFAAGLESGQRAPAGTRVPGSEGESGGRSIAPAAKDAEVVSGWTLADVERAYLESPRGMKLIFDGMIDHPGDVLTAGDLAGFLTHKPHADAVTVRGTIGAFANRCARRYGRSKRDFPFRHWYIEGGYARYVLPREVADVLRPLRDG